LLERIHPEDKAELANALRGVAAAPGRRVSGCVRVRHEDGTWRDIGWTARNAFDVAGVEGIVINSRDITARKHIEAALEQGRPPLKRGARQNRPSLQT
jgi:PAS domain S-box-containing protein